MVNGLAFYSAFPVYWPLKALSNTVLMFSFTVLYKSLDPFYCLFVRLLAC